MSSVCFDVSAVVCVTVDVSSSFHVFSELTCIVGEVGCPCTVVYVLSCFVSFVVSGVFEVVVTSPSTVVSTS